MALKTTFNLGANSKWYLSAGPVFDLGIAGNHITVYDWSGSKQTEKEKIEWGNEEGEIKRFDVGLTFGGGMEFNGTYLTLSIFHR